MKALIKKVTKNNNFLSLSGSVAASGLGFLSFAVLARHLSKDAFGNWMMFLSICTMTELLRTGLLQTGLIKFISGKEPEDQKVTLGTGWLFAFITTTSVALLSYGVYFFGQSILTYEGVALFFKWYWLLTLASLPFNFATWYLQAFMNFKHLLFIRLIVLGGFVGMLGYTVYHGLGLEYVVYFYIASQAICSIVCFFAGWTQISSVRFASLKRLKELFNFGKFSMGTMLGANMLRNSDTLLIGALLSAEAVAIYSVPLKLFEIVEIPLRSFVATALPNLSRLLNTGDTKGFTAFFEKVTGTFSILLIPCVLFCLLLAEPLVVIMGGKGYAEAANILRIFALFAMVMPLDRYTGVALDVLNRPSLNLKKVVMMLLVNIAGDILVIKLTGTLWPVAAVSIATFSTGVIFGVYFLRKLLKFSLRNIITKGFSEVRYYVAKVFEMLKPVTN